MAKEGHKVCFSRDKLAVDGVAKWASKADAGGRRREKGEGVASWGTASVLDFRNYGVFEGDEKAYPDLHAQSEVFLTAWHHPEFKGCKVSDTICACRYIVREASVIEPRWPERAMACAARGISIAQSITDNVFTHDANDLTPAFPPIGPGRCFTKLIPLFNEWVLANKGPGDRVSIVDLIKFAVHGGADAVQNKSLIDILCPPA